MSYAVLISLGKSLGSVCSWVLLALRSLGEDAEGLAGERGASRSLCSGTGGFCLGGALILTRNTSKTRATSTNVFTEVIGTDCVTHAV